MGKLEWSIALIVAAGLALVITSCTPPSAAVVVYVPAGKAVRIEEPIRNALVSVMTPDGPEETRMTIPAGWYALPKP